MAEHCGRTWIPTATGDSRRECFPEVNQHVFRCWCWEHRLELCVTWVKPGLEHCSIHSVFCLSGWKGDNNQTSSGPLHYPELMPIPVGCWCPSSLVLGHFKVRGILSTECSHDTHTETGSSTCAVQGLVMKLLPFPAAWLKGDFPKRCSKTFRYLTLSDFSLMHCCSFLLDVTLPLPVSCWAARTAGFWHSVWTCFQVWDNQWVWIALDFVLRRNLLWMTVCSV